MTEPTMENPGEGAIRAMFDQYAAAAYAKDVDAFVALYDDEVWVFDLWRKWSYRGLAAWRGVAKDWLSGLGTERVEVKFNEIEIVRERDLAAAHAFVSYKGLDREGVELHTVDNRLTWTLRQKGEGWKIVHEHTSAPVDSETFKAILQR